MLRFGTKAIGLVIVALATIFVCQNFVESQVIVKVCDKLGIHLYTSVKFSFSWMKRHSLLVLDGEIKYYVEHLPQYEQFRSDSMLLPEKFSKWYESDFQNMEWFLRHRIAEDETFVRMFSFYMSGANWWHTTLRGDVSIRNGVYVCVITNRYTRWFWIPDNTDNQYVPPYEYAGEKFRDVLKPVVKDGLLKNGLVLPTTMSFITDRNYNWNNQHNGLIIANKLMIRDDMMLYYTFVFFKLRIKPESLLGEFPIWDTDVVYTDDYFLFELTTQPDEIRIIHQSIRVNNRRHSINANLSQIDLFDKLRFFQHTYDSPKGGDISPRNQPSGFIHLNNLVLLDPNLGCVYVIEKISGVFDGGEKTNVVKKRLNYPWEKYFVNCPCTLKPGMYMWWKLRDVEKDLNRCDNVKYEG